MIEVYYLQERDGENGGAKRKEYICFDLELAKKWVSLNDDYENHRMYWKVNVLEKINMEKNGL